MCPSTSRSLSIPPTGVIQSLEKLAEKYRKDEDSSLALLETSNAYKIVTKQDFADLCGNIQELRSIKVYQELHLKPLSIIAYKQPITRIEVDEIRGVNLVVQSLNYRFLI